MNPKPDVWVVGDTFVLEAEVGGMQLGEVGQLDMSQFNVVLRLTQEEFDALQEAYYEEHGHYPDT